MNDYTYYVESEEVGGKTYWNTWVSEDGGLSWDFYNFYDSEEEAQEAGEDECRLRVCEEEGKRF